MPRIDPRVFRKALTLHPHIARLLPVCGDIRSAQNELRWLREAVLSNTSGKARDSSDNQIGSLVHRRAQGEPLQYLLGSEFFGDLELKCRPGVLIPRPETAASVTHLIKVLAERLNGHCSLPQLRVLDFCTGSGCIPLLFHDEFYKRAEFKNTELDIKGLDFSQDALSLANENLAIQLKRQRPPNGRISNACLRSLQNVEFLHFDVLASGNRGEPMSVYAPRHAHKLRAQNTAPGVTVGNETLKCDIMISNPPYISLSDYSRSTARSVRHFEPKLALVPPKADSPADNEGSIDSNDGDLFYPHLLDLATRLSAKALLFEVADLRQARRVAAMALNRHPWAIDIEIWRDEPARSKSDEIVINGRAVKVIGEGNGRSVFIWRKGKNSPWPCAATTNATQWNGTL